MLCVAHTFRLPFQHLLVVPSSLYYYFLVVTGFNHQPPYYQTVSTCKTPLCNYNAIFDSIISDSCVALRLKMCNCHCQSWLILFSFFFSSFFHHESLIRRMGRAHGFLIRSWRYMRKSVTNLWISKPDIMLTIGLSNSESAKLTCSKSTLQVRRLAPAFTSHWHITPLLSIRLFWSWIPDCSTGSNLKVYRICN